MLDQTCMAGGFLSNCVIIIIAIICNCNPAVIIHTLSKLHVDISLLLAGQHILNIERMSLSLCMLYPSLCSVHSHFTCNLQKFLSHPILHGNGYITLSYPECEFLGQAILIEDGRHLVHDMVPLYRKIYT